MDRSLIMLLAGVALFCGCGLFTEDGTVDVTSDGTYLIIKNGLASEIFYKVAKENALPLDWMASFNDDSINDDERKSILYGNIYNSGTGEAVSGDIIDVYWWDHGMRSNVDCHAVKHTLK